MFVLPNNLKIHDASLLATIQIVYTQTESFLKYPLHIHYTDHSITHSERVLKIISDLLGESDKYLSEHEKFILICATILHDIGMQTPNYVTDNLPLSFDILEKIREHHHEFSEKMILESISNEKSNYNFGLETVREYVDIIATVAKAHRKVDLMSLDNIFIGDQEIRLSFLAALLRLGDSFDIDYRRVNVDRLNSLNIPVASKLYWYRHYYVEGIKINNQKIELYFGFPSEYKDEHIYVNTMSEYVMHEVCNQIDEVYDVLDNNGLRLPRKVPQHCRFVSIRRHMPKDLVAYIKTMGEHNVVINDKVFDVYPTRSLCIDEILKHLESIGAKNVIFFGGISTVLYAENSVKIFSDWLKKQKNSQLFFCYEDEEAALHRAGSLDEKTLPIDSHPNKPIPRVIHKLGDVIKCQDMYPESIRNRVFLIPITKALNTYPIVVDDDFYCNILTAVRSSESTTAKMRDNSVGKKTKLELLSYMLFVLSNSPQCLGNEKLTEIIKSQKNSIR